MERIVSFPGRQWNESCTPQQQQQAMESLENGCVLFFPHLDFVFSQTEQKFLTPAWSNGTRKNISYNAATGKILGVQGDPESRRELAALLRRYADCTQTLLHNLFGQYRSALLRARTSYRPMQIKGRASSTTKDDTRLHPDAFPSRPTGGKRILRVFCNVNPHGAGRDWRIGEAFETFAGRFMPRSQPPFPGSRELLYLLRVTRTPRTLYDHYMLALHNTGKMDESYQKTGIQNSVSFPARSVWICFTDEVLHAVDAGQYLLEQTYLLPVEAMQSPEKSPLRVLERITKRPLT